MPATGVVAAAHSTAYLAAPAAPTVHSPGQTAVSLAAALVFLTAAWMMKKKTFRKCEFLTPWFCLLGGIGLATTFVGDWMRTAVGWTTHLPYVGFAVPVILAVVTLWVVVYDLWPGHQTTKFTGPAAIALPTVGTAIGGALGAALTAVIGAIGTTGAAMLSQMLGVG